MKILHVIPSVAPIRGGTSRAVLEMVKSLRHQGIEAEIATTNDNGAGILEIPLGQKITYADVPIWFFPRFSPPVGALREFAFSYSLTHWLWQYSGNYDLIHVHAIFSYASTIGMAIARQQKRPYLVSPHGLLNHWSLQQQGLKKRIYLELIERHNLSSSKAIHFTAIAEAQETNALNITSRAVVVPLGVDLPLLIPKAREQLRQKLRLLDNQLILLFLGRIHPKKGLELLISALSSLKKNNQFCLLIAGKGEPQYEQEIHQLIEKSHLSECIQWLRFVDGLEKDLVLQGADLFILTSYSENFGIAVLESLAAGVPVLISDQVALADVVCQHQLGFVTELKVHAIATTIEYCLTHPRELQKIGDRARQLILENYTWEKVAARLGQVYTAIVQGQPLPKLP